MRNNSTQLNSTQLNSRHTLCQCLHCKSGEYNPLDFTLSKEDFKCLDKERPIGISGHMRIKNEAMSLAESIASCIDALDELIITYNKSSDNTESILEEYKNKYPDKISLYHYKPYVIPHTSTKEELDDFESKGMYYNTESIHSLANYYNYGYIKIKYKYYVKIDGDQIYFKDKLLEIREALLSDVKKSKNFKTINNLLKLEKVALCIPVKNLRNKFRTYFIRKLFKKDKDYIYKGFEKVLNLKDFILYSKLKHGDNCSFELGGFNLILDNNNFLCLNTSCILNGCYLDHSIFVPNSKKTYYTGELATESYKPAYNRCITGFAWVHLGDLKREYKLNRRIIEAIEIHNTTLQHIKKYLPTDDWMNLKSDFIDNYFDIDKKYISKEFYDKYLKNPVEYSIKNKYNNKII